MRQNIHVLAYVDLVISDSVSHYIRYDSRRGYRQKRYEYACITMFFFRKEKIRSQAVRKIMSAIAVENLI